MRASAVYELPLTRAAKGRPPCHKGKRAAQPPNQFSKRKAGPPCGSAGLSPGQPDYELLLNFVFPLRIVVLVPRWRGVARVRIVRAVPCDRGLHDETGRSSDVRHEDFDRVRSGG
jgi:hypothetical protein